MSLPPVIERLKAKAPPSELEGWVRRNVFNRQKEKRDPKLSSTAAFDDLLSRIAVELQESSVRVAMTPDDDPYWGEAPKSQAFEPVLQHYLRAELRQRPDDDRVLWSLAGIAVRHCDNEFGRKYWVPLCLKDPRNVRWLVDSAMWVLYESGHDTSEDLANSLGDLTQAAPGFQATLERFEEDPDKGLARAARVALSVTRGKGFVRWLSEYR